MISRFRPPAWIIALGRDHAICQGLVFSYGVHPVLVKDEPGDWARFAAGWLRQARVVGDFALLVAGPSPRDPTASHRIEYIRVGAVPPSTR